MPILFYSKSKRHYSDFILLKNEALVHKETCEIILNALSQLMKSNYKQYIDVVDTCNGLESGVIALNPGLKSLLNIDDPLICDDDIINVVCCAVNSDMVIGSPAQIKPRAMFARR